MFAITVEINVGVILLDQFCLLATLHRTPRLET